MSRPSSSPSFETRRFHEPGICLMAYMIEQRDAGDHDDAGQAADELRLQLVGAAAVEQALDDRRRVGAVGRRDAVLAGGEQARGSACPRCRAKPCTATAPIGSSQRRRSMKSTPSGTTMPATAPITIAPVGRHPVARAGDGDEAAEEAVDRHAEVPLLRSRIDEEHGDHARRRRPRVWCWPRPGRCRPSPWPTASSRG